mgnify:CR=1 FL=1
MKVLIATPTVQGSVASAYARTLISLTQVLGGFRASFRLSNL